MQASTPKLRVFAEEIDPPEKLRLTWEWDETSPTSSDGSEIDKVLTAIRGADGVREASADDAGVVVTFDTDQVSRFTLAQVVRSSLGADTEQAAREVPQTRVWAEDLDEDRLRLTWEVDDELPEIVRRAQRRRAAAWLAVHPPVLAARPDGGGVTMRYDPETLDRPRLGDIVRAALNDDGALRERAEDLMRRSPTYGNLARKLAMDGRISPLPEAAKAAAANHGRSPGGLPASQTALRFVPGGAMIARVQTMLPVLQELSHWSRENDPAIVESHLADVGLTPEKLQRDTITAHELRFYARDFAADTSTQLSERAISGAKQAVSTGRDLFESVRETFDARREAVTAEEDARKKDDPDSKVL